MPFEKPNYSQIPNELLGDQKNIGLMADMREAELKVTLAICRLTFGFHRTHVRASLTILREMTGLSKQGVINGAKAAEQRGLLRKTSKPGRGKIPEWEVLLDYKDEEEEKVNENDLSEKGQEDVPFSEEKVNEVDTKGQPNRHMKETPKETSSIERNNHGASADDDAPSLLLNSTPARRILKAKLDASVFTPNRRRGPKKFGTLPMAQKFDAAAARLDGNLGTAIDAALEQGCSSVVRVVNYIAKYQPNGGPNGPNRQGNRQSDSIPRPSTLTPDQRRHLEAFDAA